MNCTQRNIEQCVSTTLMVGLFQDRLSKVALRTSLCCSIDKRYTNRAIKCACKILPDMKNDERKKKKMKK